MPYMDKIAVLQSLLGNPTKGTRNMPGTGVLLPQYQTPDPTSGWVQNLAQPIEMPAMDIAGVPPTPPPATDSVSMTQAAPKVAPPRPSATRIVPMQKQAEPVSPYAKLMQEMERQIGLSKSDNLANIQASRNLGTGMANIAPQTDLSGLYNYVNAQTGSNFKQAPDQFANRQELIEKMMGAIPAGQKNIREADMGLVKTKMGLQQSLQEAAAKARESSLDRQLKMKIAEMTLDAAQKKAGLNIPLGQKKLDMAAATDFNKYIYGGEAAKAASTITELDKAVTALQNAKPGSLTGRFTLPKDLRSYTNPQSVMVQDKIESAIMPSLRILMGSQFTENEGKRVIGLVFNPQLSEKDNAEKAGALLSMLRAAHDQKMKAAQYFEQNLTMAGYPGTELVNGMSGSSIIDALTTQQAAPKKDMSDAEIDAEYKRLGGT